MMSARASLALAASVILLAVPWVLPSFYVGIFAYAGIYALVAVGLVLLLQAGQISLGQGAFMGLGAYGSALVARAYGIDAVTITEQDGLERAMAEALNRPGPVLIHCHVDPEEDVLPMLLGGQTLDKMSTEWSFA